MQHVVLTQADCIIHLFDVGPTDLGRALPEFMSQITSMCSSNLRNAPIFMQKLIPQPSTTPVFTALHVMQTRYSDENSVRPSVRLSVRPSVRLSHACIVTKRKKDLSTFLYHTKDHLA